MLIQLFLGIFLLFAISRVVLQVRSSKLSVGAFLFWTGLFVIALVGVIEPNVTSYIAKVLGIGRGADVVLYTSIAVLFYLIFRLSIALEETRREITKLVRMIALKNKSPLQKKSNEE